MNLKELNEEDLDLNDRAGTHTASQRQRFVAALRGAISETNIAGGGGGHPGGDLATRFTSTDCLDTRTGAFTQQFREELKLIADEQLTRLEAVGSRSAAHDLFGVLRRRCEACGDACPGYRPQGAVCPTAGGGLDFPTFCQHCGCPACCHLIVRTGGALPGPAAQSITGFNIRQSELNFNAVLAVFALKEGAEWDGQVGALVTLLRAEGLEVLSLETRPLDAREALHLRSRQLQAREEELGLLVNAGFDGDKARRAAEIRGASKAQSVFSATARGDLVALDKEVRAREQAIRRKAKRLLSGSKALRATAAKEAPHFSPEELHSPERRSTFGGPGGGDDLSGDQLGQGLQASVGPRLAGAWLATARSALALAGQSEQARDSGEGADARALPQLLSTIQASSELARMLVQPYLVMVVSSASQQNLGPRLRKELVPSFQKLAQAEVLSLAYISGSKIDAVEDAVTFAPQLFRLQKSVILSEPSEPLFPLYGRSGSTTGAGAPQHGPQAGRSLGGHAPSLPEWHEAMDHAGEEAAELRRELLAVEGSAGAAERGEAIRAKLTRLEQEQRALLRQKPAGQGFGGDRAGWAQLSSDAGLLGASGGLGGSLGRRATGLSRTVTGLVRRAATEGRGPVDEHVEPEGGSAEPRRTAVRGPAAASARVDTAWTARDPATNRMLRNYGTMLDFFDYSGVVVQDSWRLADLARPPALGFKLLPDAELRAEFEQALGGPAGRGLSSDPFKPRQHQPQSSQPKLCNLFATAKVGTPNMIFPSTLDVTFKNFQDPEQYVQLCDHFFPESAKSQLTVVVIRPLVVQNGLNDLLVEILKANDFLVLERQTRVLTKQEASYLCKLEKISKGNIELALDYAMAGPSEIVVVSKLGAVHDARTLCHGSETGRRRTALIDEASTGSRSNVDSVNAMFEIAPFSSFNEFLDLQDFLVQHSRLHKYRKETRGDGRPGGEAIDALAVQKIEEIRLELSSFQRSFSLAAVAAPDEAEARRQISLFCPRVAAVEEIVLVLNPLYNDRLADAEALLVRMQYRFVRSVKRLLSHDDAQRLLEDKFGEEAMAEGPKLIRAFAHRDVHLFHLSKIAADREARALFAAAGPVLEDHVYPSPVVTEARGPLLPECLPFLFLYMDPGTMFERAIELVHGPELSTFTASDFLGLGDRGSAVA
jgi:hypothetical protein